MIKDLDWLVYEGIPGEQKLIVREIARDNNYPIYKYNDKYYRTEDMRELELVDKEIPQPIATNGKIYFCDKCDGTVRQIKSESNYCFRCGQKIDCSDVNA